MPSPTTNPPRRPSPRLALRSAAQPAPLATRTPRPIVLLVDDDSSVLESLRRVFIQEGLNVVTAANGEEALDLLGRLRPDLVVTDLCMGMVSGWDLVFHTHLHNAGLPFIVITALPVREAGGVEKLASGFFQKPLNLESLLAAVHKQLGTTPSAPAPATSRPSPP